MTDHLEAIGLQKEYRKIMKPCEITGSGDFALLQEYGRIGEPGVYGRMPVYISKSCGFKMTNPRYEDQFYKDYYEKLYREVAFGSTKPSDDYIREQKGRGKGVLDYVKKFQPRTGKMLDLGCASGATMLAWKDAGWDTHGVDPHRPSVETGVKELKLNIKVGAGENLPFDDAEFDLMLCLGPHEHAYDVNAMFAETRRTLKDGGLLLIRWRSNQIFGSPLEYYNHNHYRFFSPNTWALMLAKHGFEMIDTTDERLEGWNSYEYILARKMPEANPGKVQSLISSGVRDDWQEEIRKLKDIRDSYYKRCKAFLDLSARYKGDENQIAEAVKRGECNWNFITDLVAWKVKRSVMEAERYVREYDAGRVA